MKFFKLSVVSNIEVVFKGGAKTRFWVSNVKTKSVAAKLTSMEWVSYGAGKQIMHIDVDEVACVHIVDTKFAILWR